MKNDLRGSTLSRYDECEGVFKLFSTPRLDAEGEPGKSEDRQREAHGRARSDLEVSTYLSITP